MTRITRDDVAGGSDTVGLDAPTSTGRYRRGFRFTIQSPGGPQGVEITTDSVVGLNFATRLFDATATGAPEAADLTSKGTGVVLRLPVARRVARIRLTSDEPGDKVAAFRFDGEAVSDAAVKTADHGANGATLNVTDRQLLLRRRRAGSDLALSPGAVAEVVLAAPPQNPRIGFEIVGASEGITYLSPETSADGQVIFPATVSRGPAFAAALSAAIARMGAGGPLPDTLTVDLVVEADTPCLVTVTAFDLGYVLQRAHLPGDAKKTVLRFPGGRRETREVPLEGLDGVTVLEATVRLTPTAAAAPARARRSGTEIPGPDPLATTDIGIAVDAGTALATRRQLDTPQAVTAAEFVAAAVGNETAEVSLALCADTGGLPGTCLGECPPCKVRAGRAALVRTVFDPAVVLPAGPIWIVLRCRRDRAVAALVTDSSARLATGSGAGWSTRTAAAGFGAAVRLRAAEPSDTPASPPLAASVGPQPVPLTATGDDVVADLAALPDGPPTGPFTLSVHCTTGGVVTAGPLTMRYLPAMAGTA